MRVLVKQLKLFGFTRHVVWLRNRLAHILKTALKSLGYCLRQFAVVWIVRFAFNKNHEKLPVNRIEIKYEFERATMAMSWS
jgi:hypothetical protein